ncbi:UPF0561 protein C2orf68 homolog [Clupea harengus]|uniref:UPF0561 protein C2orf68 homolog n=1 Tax=Clupea harengus TaxID=7950 RepID=A0A6P8FTU6_CLUHA|nr:UPF0561 protein C2orf68 homolog [Clupea harengus]
MEVLQDGDEHALEYKRSGRLDMTHGFVHHIRRNQIARDDYDKSVKQAKEKQRRRHTTTPCRPRRPDLQVYHPRHRNGMGPNEAAEDWRENESGDSGTEQEGSSASPLFWLDYQADSGHVTSFIVCKEDDPVSVVERVAEGNVLDSAMRTVLLARIRREMDKRCNKR